MPYPNEILNPAVAAASLSSKADSGSAAAISGAIVLLVLLAAGVAALVILLRMRTRATAHIAALSPAERERHDAVAEYQSRIAQAEKALQFQTRARASRLTAAEKVLANAHTIGTHGVAGYRGKDGSAQVTGTDIRVPQGTFPLTASVNATVDTAGNHLLITGDAFATLILCNPEDGQKVREFASAVKQVAVQAELVRTQRAQAVAQAEQALALEQQNIAPLDDARAGLQQATADTARVDAATRALEA